MTKVDSLRDFLLQNLDNIESEGGTGRTRTYPDFELFAQDYLAFADQELTSFLSSPADTNAIHLINCVSHLKRAADCQIDTFLSTFQLYRLFSKRNLKIQPKLEFLREAGVFSSRTLGRLNTIRNRMEHEFAVPDVRDIEAYYDVVAGFVGVLQGIMANELAGRLEYSLINDERQRIGSFWIEYSDASPAITASWQLDTGAANRLTVGAKEEIADFAYFFVRSCYSYNEIALQAINLFSSALVRHQVPNNRYMDSSLSARVIVVREHP